MGKIRKLFTEKRKVMSQKSISDLTGSSTPVESSDYIESFLENKNRFLPPINFATASNFAKFGSAKQYSIDSVSRVYGTYPYDGSMAEKIDWLNRSNFYDLYIFNNRYPRTCGYAVFSPNGWGSKAAGTDQFGLSDNPEYIKFKGGPHPDPNSGSLKLSRQFPTPYDGKANIYDPSTIERESNLALDLNKGATIEFWFKYSATTAEKAELNSLTTRQVLFDLWNGKTGTTEGNSYGRLIAYQDGSGMHAKWASGSFVSNFSLSSKAMTAVGDGNWHHIAVTAKVVPFATDKVTIEWNDFVDGQWCSKGTSLTNDPSIGGAFLNPASLGAVTGSMIATLGAARLPGLTDLTRVAAAVASGYGDGWGKVSGSLDEFRYWKTARTPQEISRFWFTQIGGGTNTDNTKYKDTNQPVDLGVYYKFNEGNTGNDAVDATVLDYSGRITNGTWNGFISGSSRVAGETASAMIESSAAVSEFKDPIIYSSHPEVSSLYNLLSEEGESWDLDNNMALYHTMPEWITSEDQDKGGEQLKKLTQIVASYLDTLYLQISAISDIKNKNYPYQEIIEHNPNAIDGAKTKAYTYTNSPSPFARNLLDDGGLYSTEIFSMVNDLAALANRDEYQEFEQSLNDVKNTIYQNIYNNLDYILKSKGTEKSFRNLIRCYGVDDELIKINLYASDATYSFNDADYRSTAIKKKYIDFNEADRTRSTMYQSASVTTPNSISYIPGWNTTDIATAGTTGSAMSFEADVIFPKKYPRNHPSNLWYSYPYLTSSVFGCHESNGYQDIEAVATFKGLTALNANNNETIVLTNTDGTTVTFTTDNTQPYATPVVGKIGTGGTIDSDQKATQAIWTAFNAAIGAGTLKMSLSPSSWSATTEITLSQNVGGYAGNTLIVNNITPIYAQNSVNSATPRFRGGFGANIDDFSTDHTGIHAIITVEGKTTLNAQNGTTLTLINADGTSVSFETKASKLYSVTPFSSNLGAPDINTAGITTTNHATIALHHAFSQAIAQGVLKMRIVPETISTHTSFQLIQALPGTGGNTAVTVPTGVSVNSAGDGTNTSFVGGQSDVASFHVYTLRDQEDSETVRFMLSSSYGGIPNLTTDYFQDVYDDQRWLFGVRVYPYSELESQEVSGSGTSPISGSWILDFKGYNPILDQINNSFSQLTVITAQAGTHFMNANKRVSAGAQRQDSSGSLQFYSDVKIGAIRVWDDKVDEFDFMVHAKDPSNYGRSRAYRSAYLFDQPSTASIDTTYIPEFETLLLNWDFNQITGSTAGAYLVDHYGGSSWNGSFEISNYASGSDDKWQVPARYKYHYTGRGDWFLPEDTTSLVDLNFLSAVKTNLPEASSGEDMISILDTDDDLFVRDSRPVNHYFAIEKSMNAIVSEQMLNMFATTLEFNNLVGEPVNRYRMEYKSLGKMREAFFRKVGNIPDFNKFIDFYKWIDDSLTDMLEQLVPMSANFSDGVKNMIESHILERNKYWTKFPTLELKAKPIVGRLKGINELTYDWEHGHPAHTYFPHQTEASVEFVSGSSHHIDFGDADHWTFGDGSNDSAFSISFWAKFDDLDTVNMPYTIVSKFNEYDIFWGNAPAAAGQGLCIQLRDFSAGSKYVTRVLLTAPFKTIVAEGEWHHYTFVYTASGPSPSDLNIYVDGVLWGGLSSPSQVGGGMHTGGSGYVAMENQTKKLFAGAADGGSGPAQFFDGKLDELAIFNGALSAEQVSSLYNGGYPIDIAAEGIGTLAGYWKLGESGDSTGANGIKDSSGYDRHGTVSGISGFSSDVFFQGRRIPELRQDQNCLWWKERAESSGSFSGDLSVDANRNTMRRVMTSDVTTNKILATGEYTDPVNYPNSGFPDAAEINLAQSGDLGSRVQYKGSTYALRSFSKPYKMEVQKHIQLHGGINSPDNQRRDVTKLSAQQMVQNINYTNYIYGLPTDIDDLKDCDDVLVPNEKKYHAFAMYPFGMTTAAQKAQIPFVKGTHFAPFNLVSSSVTTNSSLVETGIDLVNLHTDGYGNNSEIPMQGPFTERHVGGMAYRHHDISDGTHTSANRAELFRIGVSKDVYFRLIAGNRKLDGSYAQWHAFDQFYRDGVAKRPVNIRNILTTTDSALSQSALGNYDNDIQILNTHNQGGKFLAKMQAATGSDGFYTVTSPAASLTISDISDSPKTLAVAKTLFESATPLEPPYTPSQFNPYISKNNIIERFSAPGDPSTAGDAFGGFGIDKEENKYAVYNALPWRNRQVRFPTNALLTAHCGIHGSFSGSSLSVADATTALTASFHKTQRNTDHVFKHTSGLTAFRSNSVFFGAADNPRFFKNSVTSVDNLTRISISVWTKLVSVSGTQTLISLTDNVMLLTSADNIKFSVYGNGGGGGFTDFNVADCLQADTWHHIVLAFDQGDAQVWRTSTLDYTTMDSTNRFYPKIWVDGKPQTVTVSGVTSWAGTSETLNAINVGTRADGNQFYDHDGYIQDISLWSTVLTDEQVSEIYRLPGYDSFGPGDLSRLKYVTTDPDTNQLHAWWQFNHASTINDVAPIGNALHLAAKGGTTPAVNTDHFLPANYYATECGQRHDNYFVQHPIPANDFGYAWITASADHSVGCELISTASFITASELGSRRFEATPFFTAVKYGQAYGALFDPAFTVVEDSFVPVDFVGLNTVIREPVSQSLNTLGYPDAGATDVLTDAGVKLTNLNYINPYFNNASKTSVIVFDPGISNESTAKVAIGKMLNSLLLNRNGPYGYPSWKQIRGGDHPIVREHKKSNIVSNTRGIKIRDDNGKVRSNEIITNFIEPPVSKNLPLVHRIESVDDGNPQEVTLKHTYANNLCTFSNKLLERSVITTEQKGRQIYDDLKDMYLAGEQDEDANPVKSFKSMVYSQIIYPKDENKYLSGSRARLNYAETTEYISENRNGEYRTFWRDSLDDRARSEGSLNSMGYRIYSDNNLVANPTDTNIPHYVLGRGTLSVWPLDVGSGDMRNYLNAPAELVDPPYGILIGSSSLTHDAATASLMHIRTDEYGGTWGELNRDPNASLFGSLTTAQLNSLNGLAGSGGYTHFMNDDVIKCHATASQCIDFYDLAGASWWSPSYAAFRQGPVLGGYPLVSNIALRTGMGLRDVPLTRQGSGVWSTAHWSGRNPWYDSYEDYSTDIRPMVKEYTVLPEFKISDHIEYYIQQGGFKNKTNNSFLSLEGASLTSSATGDRNEFLSRVRPYAEDFFKEYSHSDFMRQFELIQQDHEEVSDVSVISLKCSAVKKLLPYNGFYPVQRCLQLGALMSSSYAPYLSGSAISTYGTDISGSVLGAHAERLQSFLQPFYAPGIMYNSIKSGIAVDYPIHTSSAELSHLKTYIYGSSLQNVSESIGSVIGASASHHVVMSNPDYRIPFEALIDPNSFIPTSYNPETNGVDRMKMFLTAPYYGSSSFYAQWLGNSKPFYRLAMNNFAAEVPNFFLKNKNLTTFRSSPQSEFTEFKSGTTYYMDVVLQKTPDFIMNSHYNSQGPAFVPNRNSGSWTNGILQQESLNPENIFPPPSKDEDGELPSIVGWGFGPKYHVTGTVLSNATLGASGSLLWSYQGTPSIDNLTTVFNVIDPSFAPHAPPYLYGRAVTRMAFKPHEATELAPGESARFSLEKILDNVRTNIEYQLEHGVGQTRITAIASRALKKYPDDPNTFAAKENVMRVSSSVNLFGTTNLPQVEYDAVSRTPLRALSTRSEQERSWVIHTKWETPALNFSKGTGGPHLNIRVDTTSPPNLEVEPESEIRSVEDEWWKGNTIPPSLRRPLGMWKGYGTIPESDSGIKLSLAESFPAANSRSDLDKGSLIEACGFQPSEEQIGRLADYKVISEAVVAIPFLDIEGERKFFALGNTKSESRDLFNKALLGQEGPGRSIINMAEKLPNYILPPHLDFLNDKEIEPFAVYIFEFTHKLSQQDLSNIWQNVMPDIAVTAEKAETAVTHASGENEFFRGNKIPDNTRWIVFKIKRRSASNYFKMTADSKDDHRFNFLNYIENDEMERYNYNWPYDFFSLVELAKVEAKIGIGDDSIPIPPKTTALAGSMLVRQSRQGISPLVAKPTIATNSSLLGASLSDIRYVEDTSIQRAANIYSQMANSDQFGSFKRRADNKLRTTRQLKSTLNTPFFASMLDSMTSDESGGDS